MPATTNFLAADLGASNGRVLVGKWDGARFDLQELHRFPNGPTMVLGRMYWNVLSLWTELKAGMTRYGALFKDAPVVDWHRHLGRRLWPAGRRWATAGQPGPLSGCAHQWHRPARLPDHAPRRDLRRDGAPVSPVEHPLPVVCHARAGRPATGLRGHHAHDARPLPLLAYGRKDRRIHHRLHDADAARP